MKKIYYQVENLDLYAKNRIRAKVVKTSETLPSDAKIVGTGVLGYGIGYPIHEGIADFLVDQPIKLQHAIFYTKELRYIGKIDEVKK